MTHTPKSIPASVLVFGASGLIGGAVARHLNDVSPQTRLRLVTSREKKAAQLRARFSDAEVIVADYLDLPGMIRAFDGMEGAFVVTPDFLDETAAMINVVAAARHAGTLKHLVRVTGDPSSVHTEDDVPLNLRAFDGGTAIQHVRARKVIDSARLPVTYLNIAAYLMSDFTRLFFRSLVNERTLLVPYDRTMAFIDDRDVGKAGACLLLSANGHHLGKVYQLDNGHDLMTFREAAALLGEVLGEPIAYDDSVERYVRSFGPLAEGKDVKLRYFLQYMEWERGASTIWRRSDILEMLTGTRGGTLRTWIAENRAALLGEAPKSVGTAPA